MKNKGIYLALAAAVISGFAVFFNKFAGKGFGDSYVFTTVKNIPVATIFLSIMFLPRFFKELKNLRRREWTYLLSIGIIGGSIPFLMFFKGLTMTSAVSAAFIHKTLFIWVGILAFLFLREKLGWPQITAFGFLFFGNLVLSGFNGLKFGTGEFLILGATLLWSVEYILAKKVLADVSSEIVGWARMFFGSIALVLFILVTGRGEGLANINLLQLKWTLISSLLLFGYVFTWYKALKLESASLVTCFLVPASLITTLLNSLFITGQFTVSELLGSLLFSTALVLFYKFRPKAELYGPAAKTI